jgi:ABC-2 type transport system ATP-binding protein
MGKRGRRVIEVVDLCRSFGRRRVLRNVSFIVPTGRIAGFLGPNGAGKTTTMRILTTIIPPDPGPGRAVVAGLDVRLRPREVCRRIGYLPESMPIHPELLVEEHLRYRARLKGLPSRRTANRIQEVLEICDLRDVARRTLGVLSRGYRQRVGLADALLGEPEVLILDEPTSGLDPRQAAEVRQIIARLRERATVLLSSHVLGEVEQVCDQIIILAEGAVRARETREGWTGRLASAGRLELLLASGPEDAARTLRALPGVLEVQSDRDRHTIAADRDLREAVYRLAVERGWRLLELVPRPATLESLFLELVSAEPERPRERGAP